MDNEKIQLRKLRDFGENFSDTFQFIKQEFKPLLIAFASVGMLFIFGVAIGSYVYTTQISAMPSSTFTSTNIFSIFNGTYFIVVLLGAFSQSAMFTTVAVYMKYYNEQGTSPSVGEVWRGFGKYFFRVAILGLLVSIVSAIGVLFCLAPGVYFGTVLLPYAFIVVNEDAGIGEGFSKCFELIKENFWSSFALYLVTIIIIFIASMIITLIFGMAAGGISLFSIQELEGPGIALRSVAGVISHFFYIVLYVSVGLQYYNLAEQKYGTGLADKLEGLGQGLHHNNSEEQY